MIRGQILAFMRAATGHQRIDDASPMGVEVTTFAGRVETLLKRMRQHEMDTAWRCVDAIGGTYTAEQEASGYAEGHRNALNDACAALERRGAEDPDWKVARMVLAVQAARDAFKSYAIGHMAKEPPDVEKGVRNRRLFEVCEEALTGKPASP